MVVRFSQLLAGLAAGLTLAATAATALPAGAPTKLAPDAEAVVNGVPVACTGIGQTRLEPRWAAYPVRVEFSNARNEYLTDGVITVSHSNGKPILTVSCSGPWILLKLPAGRYQVTGSIQGTSAPPKSASFSPPAKGQMRLVLQFLDL